MFCVLADFRSANSSSYLADKLPWFLRACIPSIVAVFMFAAAGCSNRHEGNLGYRATSTKPPAVAQPLMQRGKYLARAGNCGACHTRGNGELFAGGAAFDTPFGRMYSANLTPDADTGIGTWTSEQFLKSLRTGVRPNGEHLYPVFPYTAFTKITDEDDAALFAYLTSIPAVRSLVPENDMSFPFNQRWLMFIWKALFFDKGPYRSDAAKSAEWNRGAYLVTGLAHCSACHSPRNFLGAERSGMAMTGGVYMDRVQGGASRPWSAPNLTPASNGLAAWSVDEIAAYLKTGTNSYVETFGPMNEVITKGTQYLSDTDVHAMATYLKGLPPKEGELGSSANNDVLQAGETLYNVNCGTCHQPDGLGAEDSGPRLAGSPVVQASNPASLINSILYGADPPGLAPATHTWRQMDAYGDKLSDEEIAELASYLRSAWNNKGGEVKAEQVAKQR
jgi:mono/diheme cytochrome c family protein